MLQPNMLIRSLDKDLDLDSVLRFYDQVPDYWELAEGQKPGPEKAISFFIDRPPNCDPDRSFRLGIFLDERLSGLAELSFGFPKIGDPYLGFMMLNPWALNSGIGIKFLDHVEYLARQGGGQKLFLAVLSVSPKGRALWERQGFSATGVWRATTIGNKNVKIHRLVKKLYQS